MTSSPQDDRHASPPDVPADPERAAEPVMRRPFDPDDDAVHDMGGSIGAAPMTPSDARVAEAGADAERDPYAESREPSTPPAPAETAMALSTLGDDDPFQDQQGGDTVPPPAPHGGDYVDADPPGPGGAAGQGADGDTQARRELAEGEDRTPAAAPGEDDDPDQSLRYDSSLAAETPPQPDAEQMEAALREGGPVLLPHEERAKLHRAEEPSVEDGPGTSLT
ncbi:hypothetical protein [Vallicoccus soli]|uniref:DUF5709 domain-containing protein n=1 Tax=Vallicoccus soli TaxID=2339232 RepID=A0A3A3YSY7_9ACTN|nr:hypothetical protein [Vallicoccus soli]RJK93810.1 hypothetical protein D5H78_15940 [Vallicoccus soli]